MEEPHVSDHQIISFPHITSPTQALFYHIIWYEAYKSKLPIDKCLFKQLKHYIFDNKTITRIDDIPSNYIKPLRDHLYMELQFMKPLAILNKDEDLVYILEAALDHLNFLLK